MVERWRSIWGVWSVERRRAVRREKSAGWTRSEDVWSRVVRERRRGNEIGDEGNYDGGVEVGFHFWGRGRGCGGYVCLEG